MDPPPPSGLSPSLFCRPDRRHGPLPPATRPGFQWPGPTASASSSRSPWRKQCSTPLLPRRSGGSIRGSPARLNHHRTHPRRTTSAAAESPVRSDPGAMGLRPGLPADRVERAPRLDPEGHPGRRGRLAPRQGRVDRGTADLRRGDGVGEPVWVETIRGGPRPPEAGLTWIRRSSCSSTRRCRRSSCSSARPGRSRDASSMGTGASALAGRAPAHAILSYVYRFAEKPPRDATR